MLCLNKKNPPGNGRIFLFLAVFQFEMCEHKPETCADIHCCQQDEQVSKKPKLIGIYILNSEKDKKDTKYIKKDAS